MATNHEIARLRAEVLKRHKDATRKVSRITVQNGLNISGTKLDPRRDTSKIKRYTAKQLEAYKAELDRFVSRETQYVPDARGRAMDGTKFRKYKNLETRYNNRVNKNFAKVENLKLPSGNTIGERMKTSTPDRRSARGVAVNAPYDPPKRISKGIANEKALDKLIADMQKRLAKTYEKEQVESAQGVMSKWQDTIKEISSIKDKRVQKLFATVDSLSPEQFKVLWNYTTFATDTNMKYEDAKKLLTKTQKDYESDIASQSMDNAIRHAEWAKKLKL